MALPSNYNLGYCCINTELREKGIFTSRTLRLATAKAKGINYIKSLIVQNVYDLYQVIKWNADHDIFLYRMSSETFPFFTHAEINYDLDFITPLLREIGKYAKKRCVRLTFHPGQYTLLNSVQPHVIVNAIADLKHHANILDIMGLDKQSIIVIHGGSMNRIEQLQENIMKLPDYIRDRLVLENCEMSYTIEQLLPISEFTKVPIVIDLHHSQINPSTEQDDFYFERVFKIWDDRKIKPKVHISNSEIGILKTDNKTKQRKHSPIIRFFHEPLLKITREIDVMLECKLKEQSIFLIRKDMNFINKKND
jgi:UV DNA damage endonuclease